MSQNILLLCGGETKVFVIDANTDQHYYTLAGHKDEITCITHLKNSRNEFASSSKDGEIRIWDLSNGNCADLLIDPEAREITCILHIPERNFLASASEEKILLWNLCTTRCQMTIKIDVCVFSLVLLPNLRIASGEYEKIRIWDIKSGKSVEEIREDAGVKKIVYNQQSNRMISYVKEKESFKQLDLDQKGKVVNSFSFENRGEATDVVLSRNNNQLFASSSKGGISVFDLDTGKETKRMWVKKSRNEKITPANCVHLLAENVLISGHGDGCVRMWNIREGDCTSVLKLGEGINYITTMSSSQQEFDGRDEDPNDIAGSYKRMQFLKSTSETPASEVVHAVFHRTKELHFFKSHTLFSEINLDDDVDTDVDNELDFDDVSMSDSINHGHLLAVLLGIPHALQREKQTNLSVDFSPGPASPGSPRFRRVRKLGRKGNENYPFEEEEEGEGDSFDGLFGQVPGNRRRIEPSTPPQPSKTTIGPGFIIPSPNPSDVQRKKKSLLPLVEDVYLDLYIFFESMRMKEHMYVLMMEIERVFFPRFVRSFLNLLKLSWDRLMNPKRKTKNHFGSKIEITNTSRMTTSPFLLNLLNILVKMRKRLDERKDLHPNIVVSISQEITKVLKEIGIYSQFQSYKPQRLRHIFFPQQTKKKKKSSSSSSSSSFRLQLGNDFTFKRIYDETRKRLSSTKKYCNIKVRSPEGNPIDVHKEILIFHSYFFFRIFRTKFRREQTIVMKNFSEKELKCYIRFIYHGDVTTRDVNVISKMRKHAQRYEEKEFFSALQKRFFDTMQALDEINLKNVTKEETLPEVFEKLPIDDNLSVVSSDESFEMYRKKIHDLRRRLKGELRKKDKVIVKQKETIDEQKKKMQSQLKKFKALEMKFNESKKKKSNICF